MTNVTLIPYPSKHLDRRQRRAKPNIEFGNTCSDEQVTYLDTSLNEARDMAVKALQALVDLQEVLEDKKQPVDWNSAKYTSLFRTLSLWGQFFGQPNLRRGTGRFSIDATIKKIKKVKSIYSQIDIGLGNDNEYDTIMINCDDDWMVYDKDMEGPEGGRMYKDTRDKNNQRYIENSGTCHENPSWRAYLYPHKTTLDEEMIVCPHMFEQWNGNYASQFATTPYSQMEGQKLDDLKRQAAGNTLLHELTHAQSMVGDKRFTQDMLVTYNGRMRGAYGTVLVRQLGRTSKNAEKNADTVALFALAVYYRNCNWANADNPGRCKGDIPDHICPVVDGERRCIRIEY